LLHANNRGSNYDSQSENDGTFLINLMQSLLNGHQNVGENLQEDARMTYPHYNNALNPNIDDNGSDEEIIEKEGDLAKELSMSVLNDI
jgi:hypothetical protein